METKSKDQEVVTIPLPMYSKDQEVVTIPLPRYSNLLKKEAILDMVLQAENYSASYERDAVIRAARKIFEEGLLEC